MMLDCAADTGMAQTITKRHLHYPFGPRLPPTPAANDVVWTSLSSAAGGSAVPADPEVDIFSTTRASLMSGL